MLVNSGCGPEEIYAAFSNVSNHENPAQTIQNSFMIVETNICLLAPPGALVVIMV